METKNQGLSVRNTLIYSMCIMVSIICSSFLLVMLYKTNLIQHSNVLVMNNEGLNVFPSTLLLLWAIFIIKFQSKRYTNYRFFIGIFLFHILFFTSGYMLGDFPHRQFLIGVLLVFQCLFLVILIIRNYREIKIDSRTSLKKIILLMLINFGVAVLAIMNRTYIAEIYTTLADYLTVLDSPRLLMYLPILFIIVISSKILTKIKLKQLGLFNVKNFFQRK